MAFTRSADGVAKKGKTDGKNLGNTGASIGVQNSTRGTGGKTNANMKAMGRNLAKIAAQKGR